MRIAAVIVALLAFAAAPPPGAIQVDAAKIVWTDGPPTLPKGTRVAVIEGDPKKFGMFTMRLRVPAGAKIAPHWHPRPERVTVLSGLVKVGFGETWSDAGMHAFEAGGFYVNPPEKPHFVAFLRTTVLQITGEGPWELHSVGQ
jgi:quercetin dioxygenase-like cupin family protein